MRWTILFLMGLISVSQAEIKPWHVKISIISDQRGRLKEYPAPGDKPVEQRRYIEARPKERYRIRVRNESNQTIGVVIAVDGRNILNGQKSWLKPNEPKYVLKPHESFDYTGWRTGPNRVNRFYFAPAAQSYAGAWGDYSAMGVIAAAVYLPKKKPQTWSNRGSMPVPGTGFGGSTHSPSQQVHFQARKKPLFKKFIKYEWRADLCRKRILNCVPPNRFWPTEPGFVQPPPQSYFNGRPVIRPPQYARPVDPSRPTLHWSP